MIPNIFTYTKIFQYITGKVVFISMNTYIETACPLIETALYGGSVEEVYAAGKPHPSLQGCIYGVFRNRLPIEG